MKISPQGYVKNDIRQSPANSREQAVTHHLLAAFCVQNNRNEPVNKSGHEKYYFLNLIFKSRH